MRNLICVMLMVFLPLTLASQTQKRFKVAVGVFGDNTHINNVLESHLKRELRLLGDVDIVEPKESWHFALNVVYVELELKDGTKTGWLALTSTLNERIPDIYFKYKNLLKGPPVYLAPLIPAYYSTDSLDKYCVVTIGSIDKASLTPARKLLR